MDSAQPRIVIVGASAAGLRCACRLARLRPSWVITVVEARREFSYAACGLPYVLSGDVGELEALRRTTDGALRDAAYFAAVKGVDVLAETRAVAIDVAAQRLEVAGRDGRSYDLPWDQLVLATGARARRLPFQPDHPRVRTFHTADDVAPLQQGLAAGEIAHVAIVGAGLAGCELAEALRALWGARVTLLEAAPAPLPGMVDEEIGGAVARELRRNGVEVRCSAPVTGIDPADDGVTVRAAGQGVRADLAVVAAGVDPDVALARDAGIELGASGAIAVDARLATSVPGIWAAGDCVEVRHVVTGAAAHLPFGSLANRQGRVLANVLAGREDAFPPVAGAAAVQVFELNIAATGITRSAALQRGIAARAVWISAHDRAHYWPEAKELLLQLVYESGSGRLLGVQAAGEGEVAKRVDVATQLLAGRGTLADLARVEHAYAPPFAPAVEPLAVAAWVAQNQEDGVVACTPVESLVGEAILDVRHREEAEARPFRAGNVTRLALERLRQQGKELGRGPWLVVCERGARAAEALRWLQANGRYARYLGGGLHMRAAALGERS